MARVLVIDDSRTVVLAIRAALAADGHQVEELECFVDLANVLDARAPDIITLDLEIPWFPGDSLGDFIRQRSRQPIPIVIYSSKSAEAIAASAKRLGTRFGLSKSRPISDLRDAIRQIVDRDQVAPARVAPLFP